VAPSNSGFWNIEDFIRKASRSFVDGREVPIQSSIPLAVSEANDRSNDAVAISREARSSAEGAQRKTSRLQQTFLGIGIAGVIATVAAVGALIFAYWSLANSQNQLVQGYVDGVNNRVTEVQRVLEQQKLNDQFVQQRLETLPPLTEEMKDVLARIEALETENAALKSQLARRSETPAPAPSAPLSPSQLPPSEMDGN
jgi:hypothetical protein